MLDSKKTLILDCDGVILNSNPVKSRAFYDVGLQFGEPAAQALLDHHVQNGGISRYAKFEHFWSRILERKPDQAAVADLCKQYAVKTIEGLMECEVAPFIHQLRSAFPDQTWAIVSGGAQSDLREIFEARGMADLFDGGIFGSPDSKIDILARELRNDSFQGPHLFVGDSKYDHVSATRFDIDFVFVYGWTEFAGWQDYCDANDLPSVAGLKDLESL